MARISLTEMQVNNILKSPKDITEDINWITLGSWHKCELNVRNRLKVDLKLFINVNSKIPSLYSLSLILNNRYRIVGLDVNGSHTNKHTDTNKWKNKTHKHRWTDVCHESWAYTPTDVKTSTLKEAFNSFCKECNIDFKGEFRTLPGRQMTLFEV